MPISALCCLSWVVPHIFKWMTYLWEVFRNAKMKMYECNPTKFSSCTQSGHTSLTASCIRSASSQLCSWNTNTLWCSFESALGFLLSFSTYHFSLPPFCFPPVFPDIGKREMLVTEFTKTTVSHLWIQGKIWQKAPFWSQVRNGDLLRYLAWSLYNRQKNKHRTLAVFEIITTEEELHSVDLPDRTVIWAEYMCKISGRVGR